MMWVTVIIVISLMISACTESVEPNPCSPTHYDVESCPEYGEYIQSQSSEEELSSSSSQLEQLVPDYQCTYSLTNTPRLGSGDLACPNQTYKTIVLGEQIWMAENLNRGEMKFESIEQSNDTLVEKYCYENEPSHCDLYGAFYEWNEAMLLTTEVNTQSYLASLPHQGICPSGWHLPSAKEWTILIEWTDSIVSVSDWTESPGFYLKDSLTWGEGFEGADSLGFQALATGLRGENVSEGEGTIAYWWSVSEISSEVASAVSLYNDHDSLITSIGFKSDQAISVRCLKDENN